MTQDDATVAELETIRACLERIENHASRGARYARLTMQALFVVWLLLVWVAVESR